MTGAIPVLVDAATKKPGGGSSFFILIVLVLFVVYFLFIRPQKQKQRRARDQGKNFSVGDEVVTVGGVVGRVVAVDADKVTIVSGEETVGFAANGSEPTRLVLLRSAISRKTSPTTGSGAPEPPVEPPAPSHSAPDTRDSGHEENGSTPTKGGPESNGSGSSKTSDAAEDPVTAESEGTTT